MKLITYGQVHPKFRDSLRAILKQANSREHLWLEEADGKLGQFLASWNGQGHLFDLLIEFVPDTTSTRLLLSVPAGSPIGSWCKLNLLHAQWGCCFSETLAVEYAPECNQLATQLHEALHLLGADECYDLVTHAPKDTCSLTTCLMHYEPQSTLVCSNVLSQLRLRDG
jgi:hypothetical protein